MVKWKKIIETEHGTLLATEKGTLKVIIECHRCGHKIISPPARRILTHYIYYRWIKKGNKLAVCNQCDPKSAFRRVTNIERV